jgi:branched-chain amino acid transport system substrate-binding protein
VALASADCTPYFEKGDLLQQDTVWIGAMFPTKGPLAAAVGSKAIAGTDLARREIAQATRALDGSNASLRVRRIALVACDDSEDALRAARHLVEDIGAPAILGFRSGGEVVDVAGSLLVQRRVLAVATLTSDPRITRLPQPPRLPRMVWRTAYSMDGVAEATAAMIHDALEPAVVGGTRVVVIRSDGPAPQAFAESLYRRLRFNGKSAKDNGANYEEVTVPGDTIATEDLARTADRVASLRPSFVVMLLQPDEEVALVAAIEASSKARKPVYLAAIRNAGDFAQFVGFSADRRSRLLAIDSLSDSLANARFVLRYNAAYAGRDAVTREVNPGATYDAFYLLAYGTFAAGDGELTGDTIARGFARIVPAPAGAPARPAVEVGPTAVFDGITGVVSGTGIDLQGTQSDLDFDVETGEAPSDFEILCAAVDKRGNATGEAASSGVVYRARRHGVEGALRCPPAP